jgi:FkbM family methyltransferase
LTLAIVLTVEERDRQYRSCLANARGVLHLGAHLGQEAEIYAAEAKQVVWVEALPHIHARLVERLGAFPRQMGLCGLLGAIDDESREFHISNNGEGVSSSLFAFGDHAVGKNSLWPDLGLAMVAKLTLPTVRLDTLLRRNAIDHAEYDFWVLDLQGAELLALQGAGDALASCVAIFCEVSVVEVYKGGARWHEVRAWLSRAGFVPQWQPSGGHDDVLFIKANTVDVAASFHSEHYLRHNQRRLEHLSSLGLPLHDREVLEVGAGIGDHTSFYLDRGCRVLSTDARPENVDYLLRRYREDARVTTRVLDMERPEPLGRCFDLIHCYGLLYHVTDPGRVLSYLADHCQGTLVLETCVTCGDELDVNPVAESRHDVTQAFHGTGCRPTRQWVWNCLSALFAHVYATRTQPAHEEFPLIWPDSLDANAVTFTRAVFVASRTSLSTNANLLGYLPTQHDRI